MLMVSGASTFTEGGPMYRRGSGSRSESFAQSEVIRSSDTPSVLQCHLMLMGRNPGYVVRSSKSGPDALVCKAGQRVQHIADIHGLPFIGVAGFRICQRKSDSRRTAARPEVLIELRGGPQRRLTGNPPLHPGR